MSIIKWGMAVYMFIFIMCIIFLKTAWQRKQSKTNKRTKAEVFLLLVTEEAVRKMSSCRLGRNYHHVVNCLWGPRGKECGWPLGTKRSPWAGNGALNPTTIRSWFGPTTSMKLEWIFFSPPRASKKEQSLLTPWFQPGETQRRDPSHDVFGRTSDLEDYELVSGCFKPLTSW